MLCDVGRPRASAQRGDNGLDRGLSLLVVGLLCTTEPTRFAIEPGEGLFLGVHVPQDTGSNFRKKE